MNLKGIFKILNYVVGIEGVFLLLPALVGVIFGQYHAALVYFAVAAVCIVVAALFIFIQRHAPTKRGFYGKEGFVATALSWFILSLIGAFPMYLTGDIPNYVDALFECTSGYTTTGASVIPDLSVISLPTIFFRSFTHWIGGMGVLVFILAILPMSGGSPLSIMKAESPGPSVSKMVPKLQRTAMISYGIYIALTVLEFVLLLFDPDMPVFENICHTMGTAGTGGFSVTNSGPAGYSSYVNVVTTVFLMLFGANFSFHFLLITKIFRDAFGLEEIR
ncbi:MAG: TrkH family potassium uptake protein, partial [Lachnospiraceae bacterium]|nr:TrkH family potassium uptake protein [Lachnospiraceae bacterium]